MPTGMEHERNRWSYMSTAELYKRLQKITKMEKVENFWLCAMEANNQILVEAAQRRRQELQLLEKVKRGDIEIRYSESYRTTMPKSNIESGTTTKKSDRYVDF